MTDKPTLDDLIEDYVVELSDYTSEFKKAIIQWAVSKLPEKKDQMRVLTHNTRGQIIGASDRSYHKAIDDMRARLEDLR